MTKDLKPLAQSPEGEASFKVQNFRRLVDQLNRLYSELTAADVALDSRVDVIEAAIAPALAVAPIQRFRQAVSGTPAVGTSVADIAGTTVNFNTTVANAIVLLWATWDIDISTTGTGFCNLYSRLDSGSNDFLQAELDSSVHRTTKLGHESYLVASIGAHSVRLRHNKNAAGGVATTQVNTRINVLVIG